MAKFYVVRETDETTKPMAVMFEVLAEAVEHAKVKAEADSKGEAYLILAPIKRFKRPPPQEVAVVEEEIK